jgi:mono/diheme cytochrome c family protein
MKPTRLAALFAALAMSFSASMAIAEDAAPAAAAAADASQSPAIELAGTTPGDAVKGKRVFQAVANCARCHGWPGDGATGRDPRSPGDPANLRITQLDTNSLIQVVSCGIPGSPMPYHDRLAYIDKRCYGTTKADYTGDQTPQPGLYLSNQQIIDVVAYVEQKVKGRGEITKAECEEYFKPGAAACKSFK